MAGEDPGHLALIRTLRCHVGKKCEGPIEAHHSTYVPGIQRALSRKSHDHAAIPLCAKHHHEFHALAGHFGRWLKGDRHFWQALAVEIYRPKPHRDDVF